jgi:hypothetical protein
MEVEILSRNAVEREIVTHSTTEFIEKGARLLEKF